MLKVRETHAERSRFPVIDIHTHISVSARSKAGVELAPRGSELNLIDQECCIVYIAAQIKKIVLEIGRISSRKINGIFVVRLKVIAKIEQVLQAPFHNYSLPGHAGAT